MAAGELALSPWGGAGVPRAQHSRPAPRCRLPAPWGLSALVAPWPVSRGNPDTIPIPSVHVLVKTRAAGLAQSRWRACAGMMWRPERQPTHFKVTEPSLILAFGNHCRSFRVAQRVKDFTWSLLRFRSQLWHGCEPWARSSRQSQREVEGNHFELVRSLGGALCREGAQTHMHHQPPRSFSGGLSPPATRTCPRVRSSALCSLM